MRIAASEGQLVFAVLERAGRMCGLINAAVLRTMAIERSVADITIAAGLMDAPVAVRRSDELHLALELMLRHQTRELVVADDDGGIAGIIDESDITRACLEELSPTKPS